MILPGTWIGSGVTVRAVTWSGSDLAPQSCHEKPNSCSF
jgi:hypothetical protein